MSTLDILSSFHARHANRSELALLLADSRARTLALADAFAAGLGESLIVPKLETLNPPLWELGHIAWFADHWLCQGVQRTQNYDALYDSNTVEHSTRWDLSLPNLLETKALMQISLNDILAQLALETSDDDETLYFYRLVLFHEDMHAEAAIYSTEFLNIPIPQSLLRVPCKAGQPTKSIQCGLTGGWLLGSKNEGFLFDNELGQHEIELPAFEIDSQVVTWAQYLPFIEATARMRCKNASASSGVKLPMLEPG
jgi:iron(II)-dependent oxidoreductase